MENYELIVNYLPSSMTQKDLQKLFSSIGRVKSCRLVRDEQTGRWRDFAFVEYVDGPTHGPLACQTFNGMNIDDKTIRVTRSRKIDEPTLTRKLFVRGFPSEFEEKDLRDLFSPFGHIVELRLLREKPSAFLLLSTSDEAKDILNRFHAFPLSSTHVLHLQYAQSNPPVSLSSSSTSSSPSDSLLFVGGLVQQMGERELFHLFKACGTVRRVNVIVDGNTGLSKGYAFVQMDSRDEAQRVIDEFHQRMCHGKVIQVNFKDQIKY